MKKITLFIAAGLALSQLHAQTADEIVTKYVDAIGGKQVVSSINSMILTSSVNVEALGSPGDGKTTILNGKGYKSETDFGGTKVITCVNDKGAWGINAFAGQTTAKAATEQQWKSTKSTMQIGGLLYDYAAKGYKVELKGKDATDYQLKVTGNDANATYYVNTTTYLIDKMVNSVNFNGQDMEVTTSYRDYKKADNGFTAPYTMEIAYPQYTVSLTHKTIEFNKPVEPSFFEMPK